MTIHLKPYPSDLSDVEWRILEPLLPAEKPGGRHRGYALREIINAIQYIVGGGCAFTTICMKKCENRWGASRSLQPPSLTRSR